ncbi:MAG TPA: VWA domain-containing protein [Vicinamibacterales bacterium]|nr:VWA domain-containing protein [Vicinamibacterales bacterium]
MQTHSTKSLRARFIATLAALAGGGSLLLGQQQPSSPAQDPLPTFRSSVEAVQLTVIVTDAEGNPVAGLTKDDFEIFEDNAPRPITTFAAVDIPIERREQTLGETDVLSNDGPPRRTYVIAIDDIVPEQAAQAKILLRRFIEEYFGPNDQAALVATTMGTAPKDFGQEFTNSPQRLLDAIDRSIGRFMDISDLPLGPGLREKNLMGGLKDLIESLAKTPGRKALIFVSAKGLGNIDPTQACGCNAAKLVNYKPGGPLGGLFFDMNLDYQDALSAATRGNVAVYPISPGGTTGDRSLKALAEFTGGFLPIVSSRSMAGFERMVREQSTHYLLGFNAAEERRDGRYVHTWVRVKRPGLQVKSLDGYLAPRKRPEPEKRPPGLLAAVWDAVASPLTTSGVPMRVYAAPFKGKGKDANVEIAVEIAATKLNLVEEAGAYRGELELAFAVTDIKNRRWPIWRHRATVALKPETYERVSRSALRVLSQLPLPEGRYQLRASAGGAALAGSVVYDLVVPDFRDDFSMSGLAVTSAQARDTFTVSPHARIDVDFPGPPTTAREFAHTDTLTVFWEAYENRRKPHVVTFAIDLRDEHGKVLGSQALERTAATKPKQPSAYTFSQNLALDEVPAGRYLVHVAGRSSLDREQNIEREIPITVR